jgi:hypothetical protein
VISFYSLDSASKPILDTNGKEIKRPAAIWLINKLNTFKNLKIDLVNEQIIYNIKAMLEPLFYITILVVIKIIFKLYIFIY